jgi:flavin-dependent dehydrogenase
VSIPEEADVVVIGGGPAGSSVATALARLLHRVVVLDRATFPRPHIGESFPPKIAPLFSILGVRDAIDGAGYTRMGATTVFAGDEILTHPFDPTQGMMGYQVDRADFDRRLLEQSKAVGAQVFEGVSFEALSEDGTVVTYRRGEERGTITTRFVVDASGTAAVVAKALGLRQRDTVRTVALTGYWRGTKAPEAFDDEDTLFEIMPEGWLWSVRLADGRRNITLGVDANTVKSEDALPVELYLDRVRGSRLVGALVDGVEFDGALSAHDATWSRAARYVGERFLLAGDAGAFIDPLTAHGVFKALQSGITASAVVNTILRRPESTPIAIDYYDNMQSRSVLNYTSVALTFYRTSPYVSEPFWAARTRTEMALSAEIDDLVTATGIERRDRFRDDVEHKGGQRVSLTKNDTLKLKTLPSAEGVFVVERPALVGPSGQRVDIPAALDPTKLFAQLDGRTMSEVFDGYAADTMQGPNRNLGRGLMLALSALVERGLVEVAIDGRPSY